MWQQGQVQRLALSSRLAVLSVSPGRGQSRARTTRGALALRATLYLSRYSTLVVFLSGLLQMYCTETDRPMPRTTVSLTVGQYRAL